MINPAIPSDPSTNAGFLFNCLGSFWTSLFSETNTIKGLTIGQSQELIQAYQNLSEEIDSYGVSSCPIYHKEVWQPLTILKSQLNESPFVFEPNEAVFGPQPSTDNLYANQVFQFGFPKSPTQFVYSYTPTIDIGNFSIIANNVYTPSVYYVANVDVSLQDGTLYFNKNPFANPNNNITNVIGTNGVPTTYVDKNGVVQQEQLLILFCYNVNLDENNLYNNFGYVFGINQPSSEQYKNILKGFFTIGAGGANILSLKNLLAYIGGIVPVIEKSEIVQYVATTEYNQLVVTDKHSYSFDLTEKLLSSVIPGAVFYAGQVFTNLFSYYDSVTTQQWWKIVFTGNTPVPFSSYLFFGNYQYQLLFPNSLQLLTLSPGGVLNFPVQGNTQDVQTFQNYINQPANQSQIIEALGLGQTSNPLTNTLSYPLNPVDFIFENFLQNNTACLVFNFSSVDQTTMFLTLFKEIRQYLPAHVYFLCLVTVSVGTDVFDSLNNIDNSGYNSDGTNAAGNYKNSSPYGGLNIGRSPMANSAGLLQPPNVQIGRANSFWGYSGVMSIKAGKVFTNIPGSGATTNTVKFLKIIDLS